MEPLYYESHITIEPVFDERLEHFKSICGNYRFKAAELLMKKRKEEKAERSQYDTFCTGRSKSFVDLKNDMNDLLIHLMLDGFQVWRYKIEAVVLDEKI